jgi:hypothetical protein
VFSRKVLALAVFAAALCGLIPTQKVQASGAVNFDVPIVDATFGVGFPGGTCTTAPPGATLNGYYHFTVHTSKNQDGIFTTKVQSEAHGTAVDDAGRLYVFSYVLHEIDLTTNPDDEPPIIATFTDRFSLIGQGKAPNLLVAFDGVFSVDQHGNLTVISITPVKGDPNCDPI